MDEGDQNVEQEGANDKIGVIRKEAEKLGWSADKINDAITKGVLEVTREEAEKAGWKWVDLVDLGLSERAVEQRELRVREARENPTYRFDSEAYMEAFGTVGTWDEQTAHEFKEIEIVEQLSRAVDLGEMTFDEACAEIDREAGIAVGSFLVLKSVPIGGPQDKHDGKRTEQAMKRLLTDHTQSDAQIAAHVGVARQTVAKIRRAMERAGRIMVWRPRGGRT